MQKLIIYKTMQIDFETGEASEILAIMKPIAGSGMTIDEVAAMHVPAGRAYKIIDETELPTDHSDRLLWTVDDADLTDGVGAEFGVME